jgi:hypothetical protein
VIDAIELNHLSSGNYGSNPNRSGKYWAMTLTGARAFASHPANAGCVVTLTTLPRLIPNQGHIFIDPGAHGAGRSVFFSAARLPMVYGVMTPP